MSHRDLSRSHCCCLGCLPLTLKNLRLNLPLNKKRLNHISHTRYTLSQNLLSKVLKNAEYVFHQVIKMIFCSIHANAKDLWPMFTRNAWSAG